MVIYEITREQFFKTFPPETRNITMNGEIIAELGEEVICDHCNGDVFYHTENNEMSHGFAVCYDDVHVDDILCKECADNLIKENNLKKS
jgi:hypothetical protein